MFGNKENINGEAYTTKKYNTYIDASIKCTGEIKFAGSLFFNGKLKGNISTDKTKTKNGRLVIGPKAKIAGNINSYEVIIMGMVEGNIYSEGVIILMPASIIRGDIHYKDMDMRHGSSMNGRFHHIDITKAPTTVQQNESVAATK